MNMATRLLARLGGYQAPATDAEAIATNASHGAGAEFEGEQHVQGEGLHSQKEIALQQEQAQDETGSVDGETGDGTDASLDAKPDSADTDADKGDAETDVEASDKDGKDEAETNGDALIYKGFEVTVENKPEMVEAFETAGLDIDKVNKELFSEKGLTDETREELNKAFGKISVDMYLQGWEASNDAFIAQHTSTLEREAEDTQAIVVEVVGDNLDAVMKWANDNLSPDEYDSYREAINSGDDFTMKMALKDLAKESGLLGDSGKPLPSTARETAITAQTVVSSVAEDTMLSEAQYRELFVPVEGRSKYWDDPKKYDAMRNAGREAGI